MAHVIPFKEFKQEALIPYLTPFMEALGFRV